MWYPGGTWPNARPKKDFIYEQTDLFLARSAGGQLLSVYLPRIHPNAPPVVVHLQPKATDRHQAVRCRQRDLRLEARHRPRVARARRLRIEAHDPRGHHPIDIHVDHGGSGCRRERLDAQDRRRPLLGGQAHRMRPELEAT